MIKFLKSLFTSSQAEKVKKIRDRKYKQAVAFQRNGKLKEYAEVIKEISDLEDELVRLALEENEGR